MQNEFLEAVEAPKCRWEFEDIRLGIKLGQDSCAYYGYCGGGAPASKYYENGSFGTMETMFCRYSIKLPLDIVLDDLERTVTELEQASPTSRGGA